MVLPRKNLETEIHCSASTYWQSKVYLFEGGKSFREYGTVDTGTGNYWQNAAAFFRTP